MSGRKRDSHHDKGGHVHEHGDNCGHKAIEHDGHVDYVHDGHLHHKHGNDWHDCKIEESIEHPSGCLTDIANGCWAHADGEICGPDCGHDPVPHGDHTDYLVPDGHGNFEMHCPHDDHCDHHGKVKQHIPKP